MNTFIEKNLKKYGSRCIPVRNGNNYLPPLHDLVKYIGDRIDIKNATMVEVGSYLGESSEIFAQYFSKIYCIDIWTVVCIDGNWTHSKLDPSEAEMDFNDRLQKFNNVTKLKMLSSEAQKLFEDNSVDIVYIDANHTYDAVKSDIQLWLPKIKNQGFISGHDYCKNLQPDVYRAVTESLGFPDFVFNDTSWITKKRYSK
jgi:predicted O-methyltransferase YrrM